MKPGQGQGRWNPVPQQLWLQFVFIEAGQCLGQIFCTNFGQNAGIEPLGCTQGSSKHCRQCYQVSGGPGELKSGAVIDCFVFWHWFLLSLFSVFTFSWFFCTHKTVAVAVALDSKFCIKVLYFRNLTSQESPQSIHRDKNFQIEGSGKYYFSSLANELI